MKSKANMVVLKTEPQSSPKLDWLKWIIAIALLLAGLIGNQYYSEVSMPIRASAWIGIFIVSGLIAATTQKGRWIVGFFRDSRAELRKVVWPTREETIQTTLVVGAMVVILALVLWGMDSILVWLIAWLTGQHG